MLVKLVCENQNVKLTLHKGQVSDEDVQDWPRATILIHLTMQ